MSSFICSECLERVPTTTRREYLPPESDDADRDEVETLELCLGCAVDKPSSRIYRRSGDIAASGGA